MADWKERNDELKRKLALRTEPVAFKHFKNADELDRIPGITELNQTHSFCQVPFMARVLGQTVAVRADGKVMDRCKRLHGLAPTTEETMRQEAAMLATTWFASPEDAMRQQKIYPLIPPGEAVVVAPLRRATFEPDVISLYGNPAQVMMFLCGLQKIRYEQFHFSFIGEGACADSIGRCFVTGEVSPALPCLGERTMGQVADDEIVVAFPPSELDRALTGIDLLRKVGFTYPTGFIGGITNPLKALSQFYAPSEN